MRTIWRKEVWFSALSLLLTVVFVFLSVGSPLVRSENQVLKATMAKSYVSDVQVFTGSTFRAAIDACKKAGYIPVEQNINRWEDEDDEDDGIFVLGYTVTEKKEESLTGLSMLEMNQGYDEYSYGDIAARGVEKLGNLPSQIVTAISEMKANFDKQSPAAMAAVEALNYYVIPEQQNAKLGDFLLGGHGDLTFVKSLFARSSKDMVTALCTNLTAGVADMGETSWATRLKDADALRQQLFDGENLTQLDTKYKGSAQQISEAMQAFSLKFHEAEAAFRKNGDKAPVNRYSGTEDTEIPDAVAEDIEEGEAINQTDEQDFYLEAYEVMAHFPYSDSQNLAEYIVSLGDLSFAQISDLRALYPLVASLTTGQIAAVRTSGFGLFAYFLVNNQTLLENTREQLRDIGKEIAAVNQTGTISVWAGVDQALFSKRVALTEQAIRENTAGQLYDDLSNPTELDAALQPLMLKLGFVTAVAGFGAAVVTLTTKILIDVGVFAAGMSAWAVCCAAVGTGVVSSILGVLGCAFILASYITFAVMVVVLLVALISWIYNLIVDRDDEAFSPIPDILYDGLETKYVRYDAVCLNGKPANINGDDAKRWNALYKTSDPDAGDPICSDELTDLFLVQYENAAAPVGYKPVTVFGEVEAANLNSHTDEDARGIYLFMKKTPSVPSEGGTPVEGDTYLSKLSVVTEETETAAKAKLTRTGYKVVDVNLTPNNDRYSYIGYKTTTNMKSALRDIRILPMENAQAFRYGSASYASCGTTAGGDSLFYSSVPSAGDPILADLQVVNSLKDAPKGMEPVNLFSGGNAFNLNRTADDDFYLHHDDWKQTGRYLFFKSSVLYPEDETYLSGLQILVGSKSSDGKDSAKDYASALGLSVYDGNLTGSMEVEVSQVVPNNATTLYYTVKNVNTYIAYSSTHNPKRAIYGIKSYTAQAGCRVVPANLGSEKTGGYSACTVYYELPYSYQMGHSLSDYRRGIMASQSYTFPSLFGEWEGFLKLTTNSRFLPDDFEQVTWSSSKIRAKGLYVAGPTEGMTPLRLCDVLTSDSSDIPDGFVSVQDFKTPGRTASHDLATYVENSKKQKTPVYLYMRKEQPRQKAYIASLQVASYTMKEEVDKMEDLTDRQKADVNRRCHDMCIQKLLSTCTDEIYLQNIAVPTGRSVQGDPESDYFVASYIGVSRTDKPLEAITGILRYRTAKQNPPELISVDGIEYTRAGDLIEDPKGSYCLYTTTSAGVNPGCPLTSVSVSGEVFEKDCATALTTKKTDEEMKDGEQPELYGDTECSRFVHMGFADTKTYMTKIFLGHGKNKTEACCNLLALGCNICVDMNLNHEAGGEYVVMGYTRYEPTDKEKRKNKISYAVQDIVITSGKPLTDSFEKDGALYFRAEDEYSLREGYDTKNGVSLNAGTGGKPLYLYYTWDAVNPDLQPIDRLGIALRDYGMINDGNTLWEYVYTESGVQANLNEGVLATDKDGLHLKDARLYLFVSRKNGTVKPGAAVSRYIQSETLSVCNVYIKGT